MSKNKNQYSNSNVIIPKNICKLFLESQWETKTIDEKMDAINLLIKELGKQMVLKKEYSANLKEMSKETIAEFGKTDIKHNIYGVTVNETHLKNKETTGCEIFLSICHEIKHTEQKEIELGLIKPHSKEEYQKIIDNSTDPKKAFYLNGKSKIYNFFNQDDNKMGSRYLVYDPKRLLAYQKSFLYYFQYTERTAYKFAYNMIKQFEKNVKNICTNTDMEKIKEVEQRENFNTRVNGFISIYGKHLNPMKKQNFDYYKSMEQVMDSALHNIAIGEKPDDVPKYIWGTIKEMSAQSYDSCILVDTDAIMEKIGMKSIDSSSNDFQNKENDDFNLTYEEILEFIGLDKQEEQCSDIQDNSDNSKTELDSDSGEMDILDSNAYDELEDDFEL